MSWIGSRVRRKADGEMGVITSTKDQSIVMKFQVALDNGEQCVAYRYAFCTGNTKWQVKFDGITGWANLDD